MGLLSRLFLEAQITMARGRPNGRLIAIAALAGVILLALILATGGGLSVPTTPTPTSAPVAEAPTPAGVGGTVHGRVTVQARNIGGHTWRFLYTVTNVGSVPIGGFQLNASSPANLFHVTKVPGWTFFGAGVCGGKYPGVLVYWSTGPAHAIAPKSSNRFGFTVNTTGVSTVTYSLSYSAAKAQFGTVEAPRASTLAPTGSCSQ